MRARVFAAGVALAALGFAASAAPRADENDEARRIREASTVISEVMTAPDRGIPREILERAEAIAVFPNLIRAGFVVGGQRGRGILSVRNRETDTWSQPAFLTMTGGSLGAQIGGEAIDLVLVVMNRRGVNSLTSSKFKIGGDLSASAGPVGRSAEASTDAWMRAEILSYSRSRGLFAGATVNGSVVEPDRDANRAFYGYPYSTGELIAMPGTRTAVGTSGHEDRRLEGRRARAADPQVIEEWRETLSRYFRTDRER
jgi:lipid-binding SYLF domain-containing protein